MHILRRHFVILIAFLIVFVWALRMPVQTQAAFLNFGSATASVAVGSTITLDVKVDAGSDQITSTDMWVLYDPTLLEADSVASGTFFPAVTNNITAGKVYIAGLITDVGSYKTGAGTVATITFKGLKNGVASVTYDCRTDVSNSSKVIKNAVDPTNLIVCSQNGTSTITVGAGGTAPTTAPTSAPGAPTSSAAAPTSLYPTSLVNPTALPRTGLMDAMPKLFVAGTVFMVIGVAMRVLLLL